EAVHTALRHAGARRVLARVSEQDGRLVLEVIDDGAGFAPDDPELRSRHLGLTSMEERAREIGARLEIRSAPGAGTTVRLEV
ncbi:MAG: ATP-binding protein, partial [Solirubrobacteraceae bacterium]